jgi:predicted exporter
VSRPEALARRIDRLPGSRLIDSRAISRRALRAWRERALDLLAIGVVAVFAVCLARYRRPRLALAAFLPCVLAAGATLGILALAGIPASPIQVLALLLVLALGVDYGIFVVEHREGEDSTRAALAGIALAGATTILSFGTLAASTSPALRDLGLSLGLGVLLSLILAPAALALLEPEKR